MIGTLQLPRRGRIAAPVLAVLNVVLACFFGCHLFAASSHLPPAAQAPAMGSPAPDFELQDEHSVAVRLSEFRGRNVVLLFYRGFW